MRSNAGTNGVTSASDPVESAKAGGLRYVSDESRGFSRKRGGSSFRYFDQHEKELRDRAHLARIKSLAIPPAWKNVWICPISTGHLQATGRDARGRKQHRYHPKWRETRDETKYSRIIKFAQLLPKVRQRVAKDLQERGLTRNKILA